VPSVTLSEKRNLLAKIELFSDFSAEQLEALARVARTKALARRAELFHKGDDGGEVYVVASGKLKALTTSAGGDDVVFTILGPGEVVGEISLVLRRPATATVTATHATTVMHLPGDKFLDVVRDHTDLLAELYELAVARDTETMSILAAEAESADGLLL